MAGQGSAWCRGLRVLGCALLLAMGQGVELALVNGGGMATSYLAPTSYCSLCIPGPPCILWVPRWGPGWVPGLLDLWVCGLCLCLGVALALSGLGGCWPFSHCGPALGWGTASRGSPLGFPWGVAFGLWVCLPSGLAGWRGGPAPFLLPPWGPCGIIMIPLLKGTFNDMIVHAYTQGTRLLTHR